MNLLQKLSETKIETISYFGLDNDQLFKAYAPGKWDVKNLLVHLADAESVLHERIKRVIAEPKQVLWAFNQDLWSRELDYATYPIELCKALFLSNRNDTIYLAEHYYERFGDREFVHSETGLRTLKNEFDKVALHNEHHLQQIRIALNS